MFGVFMKRTRVKTPGHSTSQNIWPDGNAFSSSSSMSEALARCQFTRSISLSLRVACQGCYLCYLIFKEMLRLSLFLVHPHVHHVFLHFNIYLNASDPPFFCAIAVSFRLVVHKLADSRPLAVLYGKQLKDFHGT